MRPFFEAGNARRIRVCAHIALGIVVGVASSTTRALAGEFRLPWGPGLQVELTQDCNDSFYADHVGSSKNAWDFANGTHFTVLAARAGVVRHVKISSHAGCESSACVDLANYVVIEHDDGTSSIYLHLDGDSLDRDAHCGARVRQGQRLASAGSTGWSTGPHLHFQVNLTHTGETRSCECGEDGKSCAENEAAWSTFWSSPKFPSVPVSFDEWGAAECSDRRMLLPVSQNVDTPSDVRLVTIGRKPKGANDGDDASASTGAGLGVGGRQGPPARATLRGSAVGAEGLSGKARRHPPGILRPSPKVPPKSPARP